MANIKIDVDTKKLEEIIKNSTGNGDTWIVHDGVEYGIFQEFGKSGHPSAVPAFEKATKNIGDAIGQAIENSINPNRVIEKAAFDIQKLWADDVNVDTGAYKNSIEAEPE